MTVLRYVLLLAAMFSLGAGSLRGLVVADDADVTYTSCIVVGIPPISTGPETSSFDKYRCAKALEVIGIYLSGEGWFGALYGNFYLDGTIRSGFDEVTECSARSVRICGALGSDDFQTDSLREYIGGLGPQILTEIFLLPDGSCPRDVAGQLLYLRSEAAAAGGPDRLAFSSGLSTCGSVPAPFPFGCTCERATFSSPFYLNTEVEVSNKTTTTLFCFDVRVAPFMANSWTSSCGQSTMVNKVEFWADYSRRRGLRKIWVVEADGGKTPVPATWGPPADNTLRVTGLSWSMAAVDSRKPRICLELTHSTPLESFCLSPDGPSPVCTAAVVDASRKCCPVYQAAVY